MSVVQYPKQFGAPAGLLVRAIDRIKGMDEVNGDVTHWFALSENEAHFSLVCSPPLLRKGTGKDCYGLQGRDNMYSMLGKSRALWEKEEECTGTMGGSYSKTTCNTRIKLITG